MNKNKKVIKYQHNYLNRPRHLEGYVEQGNNKQSHINQKQELLKKNILQHNQKQLKKQKAEQPKQLPQKRQQKKLYFSSDENNDDQNFESHNKDFIKLQMPRNFKPEKHLQKIRAKLISCVKRNQQILNTSQIFNHPELLKVCGMNVTNGQIKKQEVMIKQQNFEVQWEESNLSSQVGFNFQRYEYENSSQINNFIQKKQFLPKKRPVLQRRPYIQNNESSANFFMNKGQIKNKKRNQYQFEHIYEDQVSPQQNLLNQQYKTSIGYDFFKSKVGPFEPQTEGINYLNFIDIKYQPQSQNNHQRQNRNTYERNYNNYDREKTHNNYNNYNNYDNYDNFYKKNINNYNQEKDKQNQKMLKRNILEQGMPSIEEESHSYQHRQEVNSNQNLLQILSQNNTNIYFKL